MSRLVRLQLIAFVVIAVLGVTYVGARYIRLDHMLGFGQYTVRVEAAQAGGAYKGAEVTYRGVAVGRVGDLELTDDGVIVPLVIDTGAPEIPATAKAVVANRSAIGEQFVDLRPADAEGPYLTDGSVIEGLDVPVSVEQLITSVDTFTRTIDLQALTTTVTELGKAFEGKGADLRTLVESLTEFSAAFDDNLPQTIALIRAGRIALETQAVQSGEILRFSDGLDRLSAQLRASDPDVRRLIGTGTDAGSAISDLLRDSGPALTEDLANLRSLLHAVSPKFYALRPLLQMLPQLSIGASATAPGDNTSHFGLVLEVNNPPACTVGYEGTQAILAEMKRRDPDFDDTVDEFPFNKDAKCTVPFGNPTAVRGGQRAELADPAIAQPWDRNPKTDPPKLNLNPIAVQLATLMGVTPKR
ncbi:MCE family protein [Nocardia goodfellowii]|uniref:Phospholipid/cholesterol/gamma-HCH transport system substrate-binding protein n=1 Tax=Nocardia goodfellowii TaxID=882446 RepID=A0ABS4QB19_9NOCA|nr:MlaD family protein [Nocardia goodfellowii]MBP2188862.1 phospholipid/cholesterol/gamma-HCH transport system substrate-binding protein [Nocardia goodfellowii]